MTCKAWRPSLFLQRLNLPHKRGADMIKAESDNLRHKDTTVFVFDRQSFFSVFILTWHRQQHELDVRFCQEDILRDTYSFWTPVCTCVCLHFLYLIAFALLHPSGAESGSRLAAGEVWRCNILPTRPDGHSHSLPCVESAREQFLNQTEHCCTGYPWWLNLDSCGPTA